MAILIAVNAVGIQTGTFREKIQIGIFIFMFSTYLGDICIR